ncbi:IS1096 element passenger TnpR family protein [Pseudogemmobacter sp. W21_MBD1_M6]|uniref:IS1096 element passenger TnpR family protein n=1 Tax=Pseudogemmobacter sp. W21_MBD1_M6 TaxID=3240271 RepID=UPI003F94E670
MQKRRFPGYADFLEAMADPKHEAHADMLEWYGRQFDPDEAAIDRSGWPHARVDYLRCRGGGIGFQITIRNFAADAASSALEIEARYH